MTDQQGTTQQGTTQQTQQGTIQQGATQQGTTQQTQQTGPFPWLPGADELTIGYVQNKGWTEPAQVLDGYRNLEKVTGADRLGRTVVLPKPDAPQAEVDAFYNRLGRPADPAGYKIEVPKEGGDPEFAKSAAAKMHELGISQKAGEALAAFYNEKAGEALATRKQQQVDAYAADDAALKLKWGAAFVQELGKAQAAVRGLGITGAQIDALQASLGHGATMEFFNKLGSKMGESVFITGTDSGKMGSALTPEQAKARIKELESDKNWVGRYTKGDAEARAEAARLHAFAYPVMA